MRKVSVKATLGEGDKTRGYKQWTTLGVGDLYRQIAKITRGDRKRLNLPLSA
jgi:hypothetical protein